MRTIVKVTGFELQLGFVEIRLHERTATPPAMISFHCSDRPDMFFTPREAGRISEALRRAVLQAGDVA